MKQNENKNVVLTNYPNASCHTVKTDTTTYFLLYNGNDLSPLMIGFSFHTEDGAWNMAAEDIKKQTLEILKK